MSDKLYLVISYRWGCGQDHSYPVGVYNAVPDAEKAKNAEEKNRGGKYKCRMFEMTINNAGFRLMTELLPLDQYCKQCKDKCYIGKGFEQRESAEVQDDN